MHASQFIDPTEEPIVIEDIPFIETRGRPISPEYATLVKMRVGQSFISKRTRDSLYQSARNLGMRVTIIWDTVEEAWRVYKRTDIAQGRIVRRKRSVKRAKATPK